MSIISRTFDKKETGTVFRHARLGRDDWEQLQDMISLVYNAGVTAGSEKRAAEIREALGLAVGK